MCFFPVPISEAVVIVILILITIGAVENHSGLSHLHMILYNFQVPFTSVLPGLQCQCLLSRLGKICEPHLTDRNISSQTVHPMSGPGGFWDLSKPQS